MVAAMFGCGVSASYAQLGPQTVVRKFCEADALGARATVQGWPRIAALVEWPLEPAWDRVVLVTSYTVGSPQPADNEQLAVEVRYLVSSIVTADKIDEMPQIESLTFRVRANGTAWRVVGPPPPPHVFAQEVEAPAMRASLQKGGVNFLSNSLFVWQMFQSAGWKVALQSTADLLSGKAYREVKKPKSGDVIVYLREGVPYHAGILDDQELVVSSTLNAGIMRTAADAFPGEARFLRLIRPGDEAASTSGTPDDSTTLPRPRPQPAETIKRTPLAGSGRPKPKPRRRKSSKGAKPATPAPRLTPQSGPVGAGKRTSGMNQTDQR
ncbi:MAG: hypothetical protein HY270_18895 [Deltaproteobacteria bacterium]|nr:hypothetical protein [Deltaproteobacteria bacterium]